MIDGPLARIVDWPYRAGAALHRGAFLSGLLPRTSLDRFTVSVGSLHFGGAGKTPLTLDLAGPGSALLMKGYRAMGARSSASVLCDDDQGPPWRRRLIIDGRAHTAQQGSALIGDEAAMAAAQRPGLWVGVGADRVLSAKGLLKQQDVERFILDDAFSHHRLHRDLDLLAVPLDGPDGGVSAGLRREGTHAVRRARALIGVSDNILDEQVLVLSELRRVMRYDGPVWLCHKTPASLWSYRDGTAVDRGSLTHQRAGVVCALGRPDSLVATANAPLGAEVVFVHGARDHHRFSGGELADVERDAARAGARVLVTSMKDAVRFPHDWRPGMDWIVIETCLHWDVGEHDVKRAVLNS